MSEDDSDKDFKRISKELSRYVFELRQMLEDDLRTYVKAANAQEREVLQKLMDIVGRYFNDLNGTIRALLLAITESMVIFEEGCIHLFEDEIEMLDMHHKGLQDVIGRCDMANEELVTLFAEIGVQVSEYEKEKSKFEIVKPDGISCSVIGTLSTGAGVIFQLASKSNPMTAVASVAVLLVGGLVLQYAQNKINDIEYFVKRLVLIHNIGRGIRDELLEVSKILGRLKENIAMLSRTAQAGQSKIKTIEFKAKRVSQLCNEMYAFKSRVMPKFMPLLVAYSEQNSDKEHTLVARTRSITQKDA
ncbi:hypothetical protein EC991_005701 [Linnemannia zychae]|nr:hypothetical protein EC991_005701 [Linnemannia zychae]